MITFPCAKINIGLHVVEKRSDGYHNLETLFYPIPLCDTLEVLPSPEGMRLDLGDWVEAETLAPESNLVWRAYDALQKYMGVSLPPVQILLRKGIPTGAGLGGGSSDASSMLLMLNEMYKLGLSYDTLKEIAATLGADCPFFINPIPHYAEGIGEVLTPHPLDLKGWHLYLVLPQIAVSTQEAYRGIKPMRGAVQLYDALQKPVETWRGSIVNHFEETVFSHHPLLARIKESLYDIGADYAAMSGSGSTLYALSRTPLVTAPLSQKVIHYLL